MFPYMKKWLARVTFAAVTAMMLCAPLVANAAPSARPRPVPTPVRGPEIAAQGVGAGLLLLLGGTAVLLGRRSRTP
jgi:hypothetical protein